MIPTVWILFQTRIQEHPNEATEGNRHQGRQHGDLLIHRVLKLHSRYDTPAPLSVLKLLIDVHPEGLVVQDARGCVPLHYAVSHPDIECFRAVLYSGSIEATTTQNSHGNTPLRYSSWPDVGLARMWELLCYNRHCANQTDLDFLEHYQFSTRREDARRQAPLQRAKIVLMKMATLYNHVPQVPSDEMIAIIDSSPACAVLAPRLEPGNDAFILHHALAEIALLSLFKLLCKSFRTKCSNSVPMVVCLYTLLYKMVLVQSVRLTCFYASGSNVHSGSSYWTACPLKKLS